MIGKVPRLVALSAAIVAISTCEPATTPEGKAFGVRNDSGQAVVVRVVGVDGSELDYGVGPRSTVLRLPEHDEQVARLVLYTSARCLPAGGMRLDPGAFEQGGTQVIGFRGDVDFIEDTPRQADEAPSSSHCSRAVTPDD